MDDQWVIKVSTVNRSPVLMDIANAIVAKVLADFGIWSPDFCAIEPQP
jgi:hypothetical protein